jgi:hypothetical protein
MSIKDCTFNGLKNYPDIKKALLLESKALKDLANSNKGHLGDATAILRSIEYLIEIQAKKLSEEFKRQKGMEDNNG